MTTSRINAYRWPARLVSHKPFAAERYFITSSSIWQVFFCRKLRFFFFIFSVLSIAAFSVQDAQSQRFLPVENSPASPLQHQYGRKRRGLYLLYRITPARENRLPERPRTLRQSEIIKFSSAEDAQSSAARSSNHFFFSCSSNPSRGVM